MIVYGVEEPGNIQKIESTARNAIFPNPKEPKICGWAAIESSVSCVLSNRQDSGLAFTLGRDVRTRHDIPLTVRRC